MGTFSGVLDVLAQLKTSGLVRDYAIGGAMAVTFWTEPVATQDLDVIVALKTGTDPLDPLRSVFEWLKQSGISFAGEHALISGVPVQFLVAWSPLVEEAVARAIDVSYDSENPNSPLLRLIAPTYLVAMWSLDRAANTPRRRERAEMLREAGLVDEALLASLVRRFSA